PADGRSRWTETSSRQCGAQRQHRSEIFSFIQSPARRSVGNNREWTLMDANSTRIHFVSIRVNLFKLRVKEFGLVSIKGMRFFRISWPITPVFVSPQPLFRMLANQWLKFVPASLRDLMVRCSCGKLHRFKSPDQVSAPFAGQCHERHDRGSG